jgi:hypothetical protein
VGIATTVTTGDAIARTAVVRGIVVDGFGVTTTTVADTSVTRAVTVAVRRAVAVSDIVAVCTPIVWVGLPRQSPGTFVPAPIVPVTVGTAATSTHAVAVELRVGVRVVVTRWRLRVGTAFAAARRTVPARPCAAARAGPARSTTTHKM